MGHGVWTTCEDFMCTSSDYFGRPFGDSLTCNRDFFFFFQLKWLQPAGMYGTEDNFVSLIQAITSKFWNFLHQFFHVSPILNIVDIYIYIYCIEYIAGEDAIILLYKSLASDVRGVNVWHEP